MINYGSCVIIAMLTIFLIRENIYRIVVKFCNNFAIRGKQI